MKSYTCNLAGVEISIIFQFPETVTYYNGLLSPAMPDKYHIIIPRENIIYWQKRWAVPDPPYVEYILSCSYICDYLMSYDRLILHGASFLWNGQAYIFSAPSGTGKTTQLMHWKSLYPDEMEILNGDKPIIEIREKDPLGKIYVHSSPWKGKEGYGLDDVAAPLAGIIILRQDKENQIERIAPAEAASSLFGRIYSTFSTEKEVLKSALLLEKMLDLTPVWLLRNKGDEDSAKLTRQVLVKGDSV